MYRDSTQERMNDEDTYASSREHRIQEIPYGGRWQDAKTDREDPSAVLFSLAEDLQIFDPPILCYTTKN